MPHNNVIPIRTIEEVTRILCDRGEPITRQAVWEAEQRALSKLKARLSDWAADWWDDEK